ncbi:Proline iminopeptidase [Microbulbifer aggregans]|uniref:Proline iminopeptidase n=1 Tax=Microbulbifer aggregans TaxID=1769779 RepID=A0A1C9W6L7_9GAMM|nr:alpha/beta hydrolase [Microbulbifer aggregans]AOS96805.1 Proline iminopeptidase [Microbulbifer aggregans]
MAKELARNRAGACVLKPLMSLIVVLYCGSVAAQEPAAETCYLDGWSQPLHCYQVPVEPGEQPVKLAVAVAPAVNPDGSEPLYLLAGGPGQAASDLVPLLSSFTKVNRNRDIVMVDRRGAGRSGAFECGIEEDFPADLDAFAASVGQCYEEQQQRTNGLYSRQTVDDLELVRAHLGHGKIALWGGSWGTRTALLYQQWYPDSLSALVLDAVAPIETKVFLSAQAAEQALQQLQDACLEDVSCAGFGDWRADLDRLLAEWEQGDSRLADPLKGIPVERRVPRWEVANAIRAALYDPGAAAQLPYVIHQAARGNLLPLSGLASLFLPASDSMSMGLTFSVACAEELNRISTEEMEADSRDTFLGTGFIDLFATGCSVWPVAERSYPSPEVREHPVLLISGSADPITPPSYADTRLDYLNHKQHLVVEGGGHINSRRGCIPTLIAEFLNSPAQPLDTQCVSEIRRPPFMADAFGPALDAAPLANLEGKAND